MSAAPESIDAEEPDTAVPPPRPRRRRWGLWLALALGLLFLTLAGVLAGTRLGVRTASGRAAVARLLDGLPLGPVGRLHVEGVGGDPLSDLTLKRLQIVDARGAWLDAENVEMRWRAGELLRRRFHAEAITAQVLTLIRDPVLQPQPPSRGASELPVAVEVDRLQLRLESRPAFSVQRGDYQVEGGFTLERNMAAQGRLAADSRLHAGDGLHARFQLGQGGKVAVRAEAMEGAGGALAGALGLPVDRPLHVALVADGAVAAGQMHLRAQDGTETPLVADARWAAGRAEVHAALQLAASSLTRGFAVRAGPQAVLTLAARHLAGDSFDVQGQLAAESASLAIAGPLDWKVRSTPGLQLTLKVPDAARWAPGLAIASGQLSGLVKGDPERFELKGAVAAERLAQSGYALAHAGGPLDFSRDGKVWRLQADLAGAGGHGDGLLPRLLGPSPRVKLDGTRLADGRLLLKALAARGADLTLSGQGGQDLFGGLGFKGSAVLADAGALARGAHGRVRLGWSAGEPKRATAWDFTLDGQGEGLSTGVAVADHFLGLSPRLKAAAAWGPAGLQVKAAALDGAAVHLDGSGRLDPKGPLAFALNWRAQGPFTAGPLTVAGGASGSATVGGSLSSPRLQLDSQLASVALGQLLVKPARLQLQLASASGGVSGAASLDGPSGYGPASLRTGFTIAGSHVALNDLEANAGGVKAAGTLALEGGRPTSAAFSLQARPGAFLTAGRLDGTVRLAGGGAGGAPLLAHLALDGADIAAPGLQGGLHGLKLRADGPFDHLPLQITADSRAPLPWSVTATGRLDQAGAAEVLTLQGSGEVRHVAFRTLAPARLSLQGAARQLDLDLGVGGGRAQVQARQNGAAVEGRAHLAGVDIAALDPDYLGAVTADLTLDGQGVRLAGSLQAALTGARSRDAPTDLALNGQLHGELAGERLRLSASAANAQGLKSSAAVDLPVAASAEPLRIAIDRTKPLRGQFSAQGELRPLWDLLVGGDQRLSGQVSTAGALAGTLNAPEVVGHAAIANGRYQNYAVGLDLRDFALKADFGQRLVRVAELKGGDGRGGALSGSGDVNLTRGGGSSFSMKLAHFRVIDTDDVTATMSGEATVTRDARGVAKLVGALKVDRADIRPNTPTPSGVVPMDVIEINKPGEAPMPAGAPQTPKPAVAPPLALDVGVRASRGVFIKGKGLNVELSLDAHVGGSAASPDLTGEARVVLGSYDFAGKRFDFDGRSVIQLATKPENIRLNLIATRQNTAATTTAVESKPTSATVEQGAAGTSNANASLTAEVHVTGTAARPDITLTSFPVLPQDEVLSQVLFGSSAAQLTGAQAAELASTLASLSGGGGFDVLGRLRQFAGLDRLAFGQGASGTGVSGGKYVTDNVYIELTGGGREGPSAAVEWRVRRNFSVISQVGTQGDAQLSIQYNTTFGKPH